MLWTADKAIDLLFWGMLSYFLATTTCLLGLLCFWIAFPSAWLVSASICLYRASKEVSTKGKAVVVTGCDSGFGHSLALQLDRLGFRVFACCLFAKEEGEGSKALRRQGSDRLHVLQLDVTSQQQLTEALQYVKEHLPEGEVLWGVVNNAAVALMGAVEWVPVSTYRKNADVNVFGLFEVTKMFLPLIRRCKGRVINITSVNGGMGVNFCSPYISTKFAVEGFSDCLRLEMKQFGVDVCLVEPGAHVVATKILTDDIIKQQYEQTWEGLDDELRSAYGQDAVKEAYFSMSKSGESSIQRVVDAMTEALVQKHPRARYRAANGYYIRRLFTAVHLPEWIYDYIYGL